MPLNDFLLSVFGKSFKFTLDLDSVQKRSRIISHIYVNICLIFTALGRDVLFWIYNSKASNFDFTRICCLFLGISLYLTRRGNDQAARNVTVWYMHFVHLIGCYTQKVPLSMFASILRFPSICLLLGFSVKLMAFHISIDAIVFFIVAQQTRQAFEVTLDDNQATQVFSLMFSVFVCFCYIIMTTFAQRSIENSVWKLAYANYQRSEDLTREMVQVAGVKNAFVASISNEMHSLFSSLNQNINYLLGEIKEVRHHEVLESIKIKSEILLNFTDNILDASKLYSNRNETSHKTTNFCEITKSILTVYSDVLKTKNIFAQAYTDKNLPQHLSLDSTMLMQVMINLFSNALKFSKRQAKLNMYAVWNPSETDKDVLLDPIRERGSQNHEHIPGSIRDSSLSNDIQNIFQKMDSSIEFSLTEARSRIKNVTCLQFPENKGIQEVENLAKVSLRSHQWNIYPEQNLINQRENLTNPHGRDGFRNAGSGSGSRGFLKVQVSIIGCEIDQSSLNQLIEVSSYDSYRSSLAPGNNHLGIWASKQFCHKMGGDIRVYGKANQEVTFIFYIPVDKTVLDRAMPDVRPLRPKKVTALVVDDYPFNRDLHKLLLEKHEVEVTLACDGQEALDTYIRQGGSDYFSIVMMDVRMPVMDGFTSAKKIREWESENNKRKVDICFVSGEYFDEREVIATMKMKDEASSLAGIQCLRKPVEIQVLKTILARYQV